MRPESDVERGDQSQFVPRRVSSAEVMVWVKQSFLLIGKRFLTWTVFCCVLLGVAVALTFVPIVGNYVRVLASAFLSALLLAAAHTQVKNGRPVTGEAIPMVWSRRGRILGLALIQLACFVLVDLPIIRLIASSEEFRLYALTELAGSAVNPYVDFVHTTVMTLATGLLVFSTPLVLFEGHGVMRAARLSVQAVLLSPIAYMFLFMLTGIVPHLLATWAGPAALLVALFFFVSFAAVPYIAYRAYCWPVK
jgi:hypothetical protein